MSDTTRNNIALGIDLGTTNSLAAKVKNGQPLVLSGNRGALIPSVINFQGKDILIGVPAREALLENPEQTVYSIKRLMGKGARELKNLGSHFPFQIAADPRGLASVKIDNKIYSPVELSAAILKAVKEQAEQALGQKITRAVITVPAYFDDAQRQATRDAGKIAGLEILRIINEPTAAALAYGLDRMNRGRIAVYDLGGGTFDISILSLQDGIFEVLATAGDTVLGGDDFDDLIIDYIVEKAMKQFLRLDTTNPHIRALLKDKAEKAKMALSANDRTTIELQIDGRNISLELNRNKFNSLIQPLVDKTIKSCRQALADAGLSSSDIDEIILVGGSTRIPQVVKAVGEFFGKKPHCDLGPDEVVALGAAVQADILTGGRDDLLLLDVNPLSLGLETMGGVMNVLIPRNSKIPAQTKEMFTTYLDGQTAVAIRVFQGEREMVSDNRLLGSFDLKGIEPNKAGTPRIEVAFTIDADGILKVSARDTNTGKIQDITVRPSYGLTDQEVNNMVRDSFIHAKEDINQRLFVELSQESQTVIRAARKAFDLYSAFKPGEKEDIENAIDDLEEALKTSDPKILREKLDDLIDATNDLASRMADQAISSALKNKSIKDAKDLVR